MEQAQTLAIRSAVELGAPLVDRFTLVCADAASRAHLLKKWADEDEVAMAFVGASDLPPVIDAPVLNSDVLRRELAMVEAHEAFNAATSKLAEAQTGLARREDTAVRALAILTSPADQDKIDTAGLEAKVEQLSHAVEQGDDVFARLRQALEVDMRQRHPEQNMLTRIGVTQFDATVATRKSILSDAANLGLIDSGAAAGLARALSSLSSDTSTDALADELAARGAEVQAMKIQWERSAVTPEISAVDRQLGMARAEVARLEIDADTDEASPSSGGLSIIEQALHIVLDERSNEDMDAKSLAARALKREMLDGPGPLMDLSGWSTKASDQNVIRLTQARQAVERLEAERAVFVTKHQATLGPDPLPHIRQWENDASAYLGPHDPARTLTLLQETRILPSFPGALEATLATGIQRASSQLTAVRKELETVGSTKTVTKPSFAARTDAMRAVADLEAHRRETTRVEQAVEAARKAVQAREAEQGNSISGSNDDVLLAFVDKKLTSTGKKVSLVFDNTFSTVAQGSRARLLDRLADAAADRSVLYLTDDEFTMAWAQGRRSAALPMPVFGAA